jgi:hypothetical protein
MATCISYVVTNSNLKYVKGYTMPAIRALETGTVRLARVQAAGQIYRTGCRQGCHRLVQQLTRYLTQRGASRRLPRRL